MKDVSKQNEYRDPYGTWIVTTEGDVEGRSVRQLGTHVGFLNDIAMALADHSFYSLQFKKVDPKAYKVYPVKKTSVHVSLDIESGTWPGDMSSKERVEFFKDMLKDRDVTVTESNYYSSVYLKGKVSAEEQQRIIAEAARKKLTPEEIDALRNEFQKG